MWPWEWHPGAWFTLGVVFEGPTWDWASLWGGVIAGIFTLGGGGLAYWAGLRQAQATREAADEMVEATRQQLASERDMLVDRERRATRSLVAALSSEAARSKMVLTECRDSFERRMAGHYEGNLSPELAQSFLVTPDATIRAGLIADPGIPEAVKGAAQTLYARLDNLKALIEVRGRYLDLTRRDLRDALEAAHMAAEDLSTATAKALASHESS